MKRQHSCLLILSLFLASCNVGNIPMSSDQNSEVTRQKTTDPVVQNVGQPAEKKIIHTASMLMTVDNPDSATVQISEMIVKAGGSLFSRADLLFVFKVQPSKLESIMDGMSLFGEVKKRSVSSLDVTDQFYDDRIRLENAKATHARYLALLDKASTIDEVLKVERELERISREIDLIQGRINRIQDRTSLATLTLELKQKTRPGLFGHLGVGLYKGTKWLFVKDYP